MTLTFAPLGPFDAHEQRVVRDTAAALARCAGDVGRETVRRAVQRLETLTEAVCAYPLELQPWIVGTDGAEHAAAASLLELLTHARAPTFELCLPTRALLSRDLVIAEVNFYRLLRSLVQAAPAGEVSGELLGAVETCLCRSLHGRLALEVLEHIASDRRLPGEVRAEAIHSLRCIWSDPTYRFSDFFPALTATWEARRRVPVVLGTLLGTSEMYGLIGAGCDPGFVDWLLRPGQPEEQAEAFREFLFGTTTEALERIERDMLSSGRPAITRAELADDEQPHDAAGPGDPAMALFDFFLSRHLQATARRRMHLPGPTRTAEEYVMLHHLTERGRGSIGAGPGAG